MAAAVGEINDGGATVVPPNIARVSGAMGRAKKRS
jgi:hypothetical protein